MTRTVATLAVLLAVQVALAIVLNLRGTGLSEGAAEVAMLDIPKDQVDRITIEGPDDESVVLARGEDGWTLPDQSSFPADGEKVERLIDRLTSLEQGLPVATSDSALARFKLTDERFERKLTLAGGGETLATLYLGTAQGTRQVHARRQDQDDVYAVALAAYDAPTGGDDWIDKTVLQFPQAEVAAIEVNGLRLVAVGDSTGAGERSTKPATDEAAAVAWRLEGGADNDKLKPEAADTLAGVLAGLRPGSVLGLDEKPEYGLDAPILEISVTRKDGGKADYLLGKAPDKEEYTLKVSTRPEYFRLPSTTAERLVNVSGRDTLLEAQPAQDNAAASETVQDMSAGAAPATTHN